MTDAKRLLQAAIDSWGPDEGLDLDKTTWARLREAIESLLRASEGMVRFGWYDVFNDCLYRNEHQEMAAKAKDGGNQVIELSIAAQSSSETSKADTSPDHADAGGQEKTKGVFAMSGTREADGSKDAESQSASSGRDKDLASHNPVPPAPDELVDIQARLWREFVSLQTGDVRGMVARIEAQERRIAELWRMTPIANVQLSGDAEYWKERAEKTEAELVKQQSRYTDTEADGVVFCGKCGARR